MPAVQSIRRILPVATDTPQRLLADLYDFINGVDDLPRPYRALQAGRTDDTGAVIVNTPWCWHTWRWHADRARSRATSCPAATTRCPAVCHR
jgi:hypothetical protein